MEKEDNKVPPIYGWVCPKCGRVMSPSQSYCLFCCNEELVGTIGTQSSKTMPQFNKDMQYKKPSVGDVFPYPFEVESSIGTKQWKPLFEETSF